MKLKSLLSEMTVSEPPSSETGIKYSVGKEFEEMKNSIINYSNKTTEQFKQNLLSKVKGKSISLVSNENDETFVVEDVIVDVRGGVDFITVDKKKVSYTDGDILIYNDQEGPVTGLTQNTSDQTTNNKIQQF